MSRIALALLLLAGCGKRPPPGDPALQNLLSLKALEEANAVNECLRRDGVQANVTAIVLTKAGRVLDVQATTDRGIQNEATGCLDNAIKYWLLDPPLSGQASITLTDESADQDAKTAKASVGKTVASHDSAVEACHQVAADQSEGLPPSGLVVVAWTIEKRKATAIKVMTNNTGSTQLGRCLEEEIARWTFPADAIGDVDWPFEFSGTGSERERGKNKGEDG